MYYNEVLPFPMSDDTLNTISQNLDRQLHSFIEQLKEYNALRIPEKRRDDGDYTYLQDFYHRFLVDQNRRALEISSPAYKEIVALADKQFPYPTAWVLCMDGRVLPILISGAAADIGDSLRVPGGNIREFVRGVDGKFTLLERSNFAMLLQKAFGRLDTDTIVEVFDSHVACAAVKAEEISRGREPADGGLLRDILHKKEMAEATVDFVRHKIGDRKKVIVIQTSFDPHNGFMFMGLETEKALSIAEKQSDGEIAYPGNVIHDLVLKGHVLSTEHLADELSKLFAQHLFEPDWTHAYVETADTFWKAIQKMKSEAYAFIDKKVLRVYPDISKKECEERSLLLLTNAFSGYLHNRGKYPYAMHNEEIVSVSEAGYPPYGIASFVVLNQDEKNLSANVELSSALVRTNRKEERIRDHSKIYKDTPSFVRAPVPMLVQEIVREQITEDEWERLSRIDWSDMPKNWNRMSDVDFLSYLQSKGTMPIGIAMGINNLRRHMWILFDPDSLTSPHLIAHHKIALPVIANKNRMNYFIVPFVKLGFS